MGVALVGPVAALVLILTLELIHFLEALHALAGVAAQRVHALGISSAMIPLQKALVKVLTGLVPISRKPILALTRERGLKIHTGRIGVA